MDKKELEAIGLTEGEARTYLALLDLGKSTVGGIIRKSKISSSKIYDVLNRLVTKGVVGYYFEGKIKTFKPLPPQRLLGFINTQREEFEEKTANFQKILPELNKRFKSMQSETRAETLEGINGIKTFFEMSLNELKPGESMYTIGYPSETSLLLDRYFKGFHKRKDIKKIRSKVIYTYDAWFVKKRKRRQFAKYRYLPKEIENPAFIHMFNDYVGTIIVTKEQKLCFLIKNKEVAKSYLQYFRFMWKNSVEPKG